MVVVDKMVDVVTSPDGVQYVPAKANERADLVCDHTQGRFKELGRSRWRRLDTSSAARTTRREAALVAKGRRAAAERKAAKKAARKALKKTALE